ncbi:MAG TPA: SUMF1/EgtB/PvdO family nonheme iron enzyme [Thermoanaerobaculia bacterium]|jgi:formylglycine-generating enzyme required for sulfatase activity|nr:SUMF1/EgtB/PvdO family nonheme iron enzyme [Thermoanaerobaculia bacterium]
MELAPLAEQVVAALAPALPFLLDKGATAADAAIKEMGKDAWEKAKSVWARLRGKIAKDEDAEKATEKLALDPKNGRLQRLLAPLLEGLLEGDEGTVAALRELLGAGETIQQVEVSGAGAASQALETAISAGAHGNAIGGHQINVETLNLYVQSIVGSLAGAVPPPDLERGMAIYQRKLLQRHTHLEFRGMGVNDRIPLLLPLLDLYVPGRAHARLPEGEAAEREAGREVRLGGRRPSAEEIEGMGTRTRAKNVLDLLRTHDGLVLLGDPGAGKSTLLKFLALRFARGEGEALGLGLRLPVLAPLATYAGKLAKDRSLSLPAFLAALLEEQGVVQASALVDEGLCRGRLLFLFDGLDEVSDETLRHLVVARVKDFYCAARQAGNKFVLTSRIVGYLEVRLEAEGLAEGTLTDFDDREIEIFVIRWTAAVENAARGAGEVASIDAARERNDLLRSIRRDPGVRRLAANPLLLTILALVKRQGIELPERRAELYDLYLRVLLRQWNLARSLSGEPSPALEVRETLQILAPLALWMQEESPGKSEVAEGALRAEVTRRFEVQGEGNPVLAADRFLDGVRRHTALLIDRGGKRFGFIHPTFQEYLAAVAWVRTAQMGIEKLVEALAERMGDPAWLEVSLLAIGDLAREREEAAGQVLTVLLTNNPGPPGEVEIFAGRAVLDAGHMGVPAEVRAQVIDRLLPILRNELIPAARRAAAGEVLAGLGDPRIEVMTLAGMEFCWIPAGRFLMGSRKNEEDSLEEECEQHELGIDYGYGIGRFPVTVAQFVEYIERSGNRPKDALRGAANTPVNWLSWHEALGFCHWLTETWRSEKRIPERCEVRLPSEAEWEKVARGGLEIPTTVKFSTLEDLNRVMTLEPNPEPSRAYPWGASFDPNRGNCYETGIGRPSAVGCFPGGVSPYGTEELTGNVWEWTRSVWGIYYWPPTYWYPYEPRDGRESLELPSLRVLRGGAFTSVPTGGRCATRLRGVPKERFDIGGFRVVVSPIPALSSDPLDSELWALKSGGESRGGLAPL